jgi:hypothetical protein
LQAFVLLGPDPGCFGGYDSDREMLPSHGGVLVAVDEVENGTGTFPFSFGSRPSRPFFYSKYRCMFPNENKPRADRQNHNPDRPEEFFFITRIRDEDIFLKGYNGWGQDVIIFD